MHTVQREVSFERVRYVCIAVTEQHTFYDAVLCIEWTQCTAVAITISAQITREQRVIDVTRRKSTKATVASQ